MIDAPTLQPAVDYLTRSSVGPFIDTGRDAPKQSGRGLDRIYISLDTLTHMADVAGVRQHNTKDELDAEYRRGFIDGVRAELGVDLGRVVNVLDRLLPLLRDVDDPARVSEAV